jgi:hypothetical protein
MVNQFLARSFGYVFEINAGSWNQTRNHLNNKPFLTSAYSFNIQIVPGSFPNVFVNFENKNSFACLALLVVEFTPWCDTEQFWLITFLKT